MIQKDGEGNPGRFELFLAFSRWGWGCTLFSSLFLLLASQSLLHTDFRKAKWASACGKSIFFLKPRNSLSARQYIAGTAAAETDFEGLVQRHGDTPIAPETTKNQHRAGENLATPESLFTTGFRPGLSSAIDPMA